MTRRRITVPDLYASLSRLIAQVPRGRVTTFGDLGEALGTLRAARWVAEYVGNHEHDTSCNCHRVIRRTGELGGYFTGDTSDKAAVLHKERIDVDRGLVDLERYGFDRFRSRKPLQRLLRLQDELRDEINLKPYREKPKLVAGVDLSYEKKSPGQPCYACATYAVVETRKLDLVRSHTIRRRVKFPYISGFLSFREAPILLQLLDYVRKREPLAKVILADGNGIMHPRRVGVATFLGVIANVRTIGIAKTFLCGTMEGDDSTPASTPRAIRLDGRKVGYVLGSNDASRPVFLSPGNRVSLANALSITRGLFAKHRVPEPIYHADRISREAIKGT